MSRVRTVGGGGKAGRAGGGRVPLVSGNGAWSLPYMRKARPYTLSLSYYYCRVTPQHMLLNRNALFVKGLRPHNYCLPVLKREIHREWRGGGAQLLPVCALPGRTTACLSF